MKPRIVLTLRMLASSLLLAAGARSFADSTFTVTPVSPGCQLLSAPAGTPLAFCETFDAPAGTGNRSGQLNGTLWGVSRLLGFTNSGQNQYFDVAPTTIQLCGTSLQVIDPSDVQICDGQLVESVWDQTSVTSLAMYPKQPFDISGGRTGTIAFDVSDDSNGNHSVWPELWWADQPVPVPFVHESSLQSVPANGFGVRFAEVCEANSGAGCGARTFCPTISEDFAVVTVDSAVVINNYISNDSFDPVGSISVQPVDCVIRSSGPGNMNHFELRVSQNEIDVYGTDAGTTGPLKKIAIISNMTLSLTRGVVYLEDVHYNANKGVDPGPPQGIHTFTWDNLAFDGPVLPRDLAFDVLDALTPVGSNYPGILNTGWPVSPNASTPLTLTVPGVSNIASAADAILTFNFVDFNTANLFTPAPFISYRVNNGAPQIAPWPFGPCPVQNGLPACGVNTIAVQVSLSDVQPGTNTIQFTATDYAAIANVDLILQGAGGSACTANCPAPTTTALTSSPNPSYAGSSITFTAKVSSGAGIPSGSVTFSDSGNPLGSAALNGSGAAIFTTSSLAAGTHTINASYGGAAGFLASTSAAVSQIVDSTTAIQFDWEDGKADGWQVAWGKAVIIANSTAEAFSGTHSLKISIAPGETHSAVDNETISQLTAFTPGTIVTLHVFNSGLSGITALAFAYDEIWIPSFGPGVVLQPGWNTMTYVIPPNFLGVNGIGVQFNVSAPQTGSLYLDAVSTTH
jgi:hypothetical protein